MIAAVACLLAAGLAVVLGVAAAGPVGVLVAAITLLQVLVAARWFVAQGVSDAARGGTFLGAAAAVGSAIAVAVRDERHPLAPVTAVLGLAMLAAMLHQLARRDGREHLTDSLAATVSLAVVGTLGSCYLGAQASREGAAFVIAGVAAAALAVVAAALPGPGALRAGAGLLAGAAAGAVVGQVSELGVRDGALVGLCCAVAAAITVAVACRAARPDPFVTGGLPLLLAAPVAFLLARLLAP